MGRSMPPARGRTVPRGFSTWNAPEMVTTMAEGLHREAATRDAAHDPRGLDALKEIKLHPLLAAALGQAGWGVWPEQRYPTDRRQPWRNHGRRCDLVLTPAGRPLAAVEGANGNARLPFPQGDTHLSPVPLRDAFWLEVKTVSQFRSGRPARNYSAGLLTAATEDVGKIASDPGLLYAGLLVIAFTLDQATALNDLDVWRLRCLQDDLPLLSPATTGFGISDRTGNGHCSLALFPILPATA